MGLYKPVPLGDVHSELSSLIHAAEEYLKDLDCAVKIEYDQVTYLNLVVEVWGAQPRSKRVQAVVDRLQHGILWGEYDYRFRMITRPLSDPESYRPTEVRASLDLSHWPHRKPHGWDPSRPHVDGSQNGRRQPPAPAPRRAAGGV